MPVAAALSLLLALLIAVAELRAEPALRDGFEGAELSWRDAGGDAPHKVLAQDRISAGGHSGGCERLRVAAGNGTTVYYSHDLPEARLINELTVGVWLKADRPGVQILVRAVLPRSLDQRTGRPLTTLLRGSGYTQAGNWQQLRVDHIPQQFERQVRVLRAQFGPQIDEHEAYIDRVLLNVYAGAGTTTVSIDDLDVTGFVPRLPAINPIRGVSFDAPVERLPDPSQSGPIAKPAAPTGVARLSGQGLVVGDTPLFPRLVEYRGESLAQLQSLGFNGVRLTTAPTPALLAEAAATKMWLVAPPPASAELEALAARGPTGRLGTEFDRVLVWDLGQDLATRDQLEATRRWSRMVRAADTRGRPVICGALTDLRLFTSRSVADLLWTVRTPLGSSLNFEDYAAWLRERTQLARPGTPIWATIQTQPAERLLEQVAWLSDGKTTQFAWQDEQIRRLTFAALAAGARGVCFESPAPLNATDPATRRRAALLELLNLELELIEPWCASGSFVTSAGANDPTAAAAVMQTDRARLVLPLASGTGSQFVLRMGTDGASNCVVPGVPESNDAFELTPAGLRPLAHKRVAGGIRVVLPEGERGSLIVLTQDPQVIANLSHRAERVRKRAAELTRDLTAFHLERVEEIEQRLNAGGHATPSSRTLIESARASLKQAEARLSAADFQNARQRAQHANQLLYQLERNSWEKANPAGKSPLGSPPLLAYETLPDFWQFSAAAAAGKRGPNLLPGGEFEDLPQLLAAGWRHYQRPSDPHGPATVTTQVDLSTEHLHGGKLSLRLKVAAADPALPPALVETAPLWITTAPIAVESGQWICIHGWVQQPKAPTGTVDGLYIIDSLGGEALAERIGQTNGWQELTLYRAAPRSENLVVTFALAGLGEAWLDDFTVEVVNHSAPAAEQAQRPPAVR